MMKEKQSISIDGDLIKAIKSQAKKENRNFSNMVEVMASEYLKTK